MSLMILVADPYRSETGDDPVKPAAKNHAALQVFRAGHLPVTGEAPALPLVELASSPEVGDPAFDEIYHPTNPGTIPQPDHREREVLNLVAAGMSQTSRPGPARRKDALTRSTSEKKSTEDISRDR